jgi:galactokinase
MGDYTDINDGFVLPVALDLRTAIVGTTVAGRLVLRSRDRPGEVLDIDLSSQAAPVEGWGRYVQAVADVLRDAGYPLRGLTGEVSSDVPIGAGLSSSAALEVAVARALLPEQPDPLTLARLCQRAENDGVGVQSGIMDQLASAGARDGFAMLIDCRSLDVTYVAVPPDLAVLVVDSGVRRSLTDSHYNERRTQCAAAARALGVSSLRDVDEQRLARRGHDLDDLLLRRARHIVSENDRVHAATEALEAGDRPALGQIFAQSHASLRDDFEVSIGALDALVDVLASTSGVVATRMTGAGFGGCAVALVEASQAEAAKDAALDGYAALSGRRTRAWVSRPAGST